MKLYEMYFSPTGGTEKAVGIIGSVWNCEKERINLLLPEEGMKNYDFASEDICIIAVPSFGGRVPAPALKRLSRMKGCGARAILTAVYGNRDFDDTLIELREAVLSAGFSCEAAIAAVAEHSIAHEVGRGRPDEKDEEVLTSFAVRIKEYLERPHESRELKIPGNHPYREYKGVPLKPKANRTCNQCGLCARQCPVHAIPKEKLSSVDKTKCISCMHCIAVCPQKARRCNPLLVKAASRKLKKNCSERKENQLFL
mgnify:CR=1 FL=1|jgi:ferredoxin